MNMYSICHILFTFTPVEIRTPTGVYFFVLKGKDGFRKEVKVNFRNQTTSCDIKHECSLSKPTGNIRIQENQTKPSEKRDSNPRP